MTDSRAAELVSGKAFEMICAMVAISDAYDKIETVRNELANELAMVGSATEAGRLIEALLVNVTRTHVLLANAREYMRSRYWLGYVGDAAAGIEQVLDRLHAEPAPEEGSRR